MTTENDSLFKQSASLAGEPILDNQTVEDKARGSSSMFQPEAFMTGCLEIAQSP
jgi:hypothetical protein